MVESTSGFVGWRFPERAGTIKHGPTLDKPQTKFWYHREQWWAILAQEETRYPAGLAIFRFDSECANFHRAGPVVTRAGLATADACPDGDDLYIATRSPESGIELHRLRFDTFTNRYEIASRRTWHLPGVSTPSVSVAVGYGDNLVLTYATDRPYLVMGPKANYPDLGVPTAVPGSQPGLWDVDLSAVVALDTVVALLWSDQSRETFFCALIDPDGTATIEVAASGGLAADDHIAARVYGDRLFVAVKTSCDVDPEHARDDALILLLIRELDGRWHEHMVCRTDETVTRPMPLIDPESQLVHVLYTHGPNPGHRSIRARSARLDDLNFSSRETVVMNANEAELNDVTSSRMPLTAATGALVGASDGVNRRYHFAFLSPGLIPRSPIPL